MKIDFATLNNDAANAKSKSKLSDLLPLVPIETNALNERETIILTLSVNPLDQDSPKYKAKFLVLCNYLCIVSNQHLEEGEGEANKTYTHKYLEV